MTDLHEAVESLLSESVGSRPTEDLKIILDLLQEDTASKAVETPAKRRSTDSTVPATAASQSLRQKLGHNVDDLKECLCEMMADRVGIEELLPMTYDEEANEDAMADHNALTLTNSSMLATQVFARLLASPGAFSAGLVDLHAVSELPRILARWRTECIGREWAISCGTQKHAAPSMKNLQSTKRARTMSDDDDDDEDSEDEQSDDESQNASSFFIDIPDDNALTEPQLVLRGLEIALLVADLPMQKHFGSWNKDCRSAVIDAVSSSLATTAALFLDKRRGTDTTDSKLQELATAVFKKAPIALTEWLTVNKSLSAEQAAEILIDVQRNMYSLITLIESDFPNADEGKFS